MMFLFNEILYRPLFNLLVGIYNTIPGHDLGVAIILLTILIRIVFIPLSLKALRSQKAMAEIQPKIQGLQVKHKGDKQGLAQAQMALWKEHKVNPLSGCLPILIQLPVIWALYRVFINGVKPENLSGLYSFVHNPGSLGNIGLGFLDLAQKYPVMAIIAGVLQGVQSYLTTRLQKTPVAGVNDAAAKMTKQMMYIFPVMIVVISWSLPAGLVLYWITTTAFAIFELVYIRRRYQ
ncbi:MAG: YidC/Oxa1 family membrane protein insertase [Patescibacteria group bacterium]